MLVTGMTGAGKGSAAKGLEKLGYYVIDNLPADLLVETVETVEESEVNDQLAVVVDARSRPFFDRLVDVLEELRADGTHTQILFLEAADEVLVRRQEAARRPHPLSREGRLMDGFDRERELLSRLRGRADIVVDTTNLNVHQLGQRIQAAFEDRRQQGPARLGRVVRVQVRHPHRRRHGGRHAVPAQPVLGRRAAPAQRPRRARARLRAQAAPVRGVPRPYEGLVALLTDGFLHEDKHFLTIAIGCTGGRHRSVVMAEAFAERLRAHGVRTLVVHRDLGRE